MHKKIKMFLASFLSILFIAIAAIVAEDPPQGAVNLRIDFGQSKGFANYANPEGLQDDEAQMSENIEYYKKRDLSVRKSVNDILNQNPVTGGFPRSTANWSKYFKSTTSAVPYLYTKVGENLLYWNLLTNGVASYGNTFGPVNNPGQSDAIIQGETLYIVCETSSSKFVKNVPDAIGNMVSVNSSSAIPSGKYAQFHLDRFLVSGNTTTANRVFYSWHDQPLNFHPLDFFDIQSAKRDNIITGIGEPFLGMLPIYTRYSTRVMVGNSFPDGSIGGNLTERVISDSIGCFHHWTIKNRKDGQYFLSEGVNGLQPGIYKFNGVSLQEVTINYRQYFIDNVRITTAIVPSAFTYDDKYCLIHTSKSGVMNSRMVCLDERNVPTFYKFDRLYVDYFDVFESSAFALNNAVGSADFGIVSFGGAAQFDTILGQRRNIEFKYQTKDFDFGAQNRTRIKRVKNAYIDFQKGSGNFTISAIYDFGLATTTWVIDTQTDYGDGRSTAAIRTVARTSSTIINRIVFPEASPTNPRENNFNFINFLITSSASIHINSIDIYAVPQPLP